MEPQVLIPIDFSEQSLIALDQSYNLAKFYNAELTLLHVIETGNVFNIFGKRDADDEAIKSDSKRKLEELGAEINKKYNIKANVIVT